MARADPAGREILMCGITGWISREGLSELEREKVTRMNSLLEHRGPDGAGEFQHPNLSMAMRRLSIIDLQGGWQPLYNEDRTLALILNGEIYNFIELREQLQAKGHIFRTRSDGETVLHLYEEYGDDCVHSLRGMFAFALWDGRRRRLLLARDRMGEKPLYLWEGEDRLIFASELKALLQSGTVPFELDAKGVSLFFNYQYVPEPATPIRDVRKLPPAHLLTVDLEPWKITERRYWNMEDAPPLKGSPGELLRAELETVSELVIRSDVPVGIALSGGLDSGSIAVLAARKYPGIMHAFSVGYPGYPGEDERVEARALAEYLGMPFHEVEVETGQVVDFFPELIFWHDDPIADISGYGYYAVMRLAREHGVPVMLQGQGGDELFWGYEWVRQAAMESHQKSALRKRGWAALPDYLIPALPGKWTRNGLRKWISSVGGLRPGWERFQQHRASPPDRLRFYDVCYDFAAQYGFYEGLYAPAFRERLDAGSAYEPFTRPWPWPPVDIVLTHLICDTYLLENGITQGDRLSMASSVELRLPLVDYRLVETVIGLRKTCSDRKLPPKAWLKDAMKGILPDWVMNRPKRGFSPPVRLWTAGLFEVYRRNLKDGYLVQAGILKPEAERLLAGDPSQSDLIAMLSFRALVLEMWCRRFS
jgi:asparagine synthase (glutamine-hydrolysing)